MPQTAGKPSPTPTKAVASTEGEDKTKQRKQFKKTALRTNLFTVALPLGITGLLYGAMAMCCIMWPQSFLATSYIGYSTAWLVKINPFAITVIFNLSFLGTQHWRTDALNRPADAM